MPAIFPVQAAWPRRTSAIASMTRRSASAASTPSPTCAAWSFPTTLRRSCCIATTGIASARATEHMEAIGYVNVYDAGGLAEWPYDVVTTDEERAVAAALAASGNVVRENASLLAAAAMNNGHGNSCGCGC